METQHQLYTSVLFSALNLWLFFQSQKYIFHKSLIYISTFFDFWKLDDEDSPSFEFSTKTFVVVELTDKRTLVLHLSYMQSIIFFIWNSSLYKILTECNKISPCIFLKFIRYYLYESLGCTGRNQRESINEKETNKFYTASAWKIHSRI